MPRTAGASISRGLVLAGAAVVLAACGSGNDGMYEQYFQVAKQSLSASFGDRRVSREEAAAIPYASMGYRVDGGAENLLVLGSDAGGNLLWTAKTHVVILTRHGRIVRTVGLPHDISAVVPQGGKTLPAPSAALAGRVVSERFADFPDISAYGVPLTCSASAIGPQTVTILGNAIRTVRVDETCGNRQLRWSFVDNYWVDPQSGLVWRSIQHIHPRGETVETEIFRPPG